MRKRRPPINVTGRYRKWPFSIELRQIMRMFIAPFVETFKTDMDPDNALRDGTNVFFQVHDRDVYFAKALENFQLPGKAWRDSPHHAALEGMDRRVKRDDPLTIRIDHRDEVVEIESDETVFVMPKSLYDRRLKRKIKILC